MLSKKSFIELDKKFGNNELNKMKKFKDSGIT